MSGLLDTDRGRRGVVIRFNGLEMESSGADPQDIFFELRSDVLNPGKVLRVPWRLLEGEKTLKVQVFLDKCVMEIFLNERACFTRGIYPLADDLWVALFAAGGSVKVKSVDVWSMKPIW